MKKFLSAAFAFVLVFSVLFPIPAFAENAANAAEETIPAMPRVTKDPTDEHVKEDGYCEFVSRADYANKIIWHLVSPTGVRDILAKNAPNEFPGLWVTGLESEKLGLDHIPRELNGWHVRAEFAGRVGNLYSLDAVIYVEIPELEIPTISAQPQGFRLGEGEKAELRIDAATTVENGELLYQWYSNTIDANIGGKELPNATEAVYVPEYTIGTLYYYCVISVTNGVDTSSTVRSQCAAVTCAAPETAAPAEPETTIPETTIPETTIPETTIPETTIPETTVPETEAPTEPETTAIVPIDVLPPAAPQRDANLVSPLLIAIPAGIVLLFIVLFFIILGVSKPRKDAKEDSKKRR